MLAPIFLTWWRRNPVPTQGQGTDAQCPVVIKMRSDRFGRLIAPGTEILIANPTPPTPVKVPGGRRRVAMDPGNVFDLTALVAVNGRIAKADGHRTSFYQPGCSKRHRGQGPGFGGHVGGLPIRHFEDLAVLRGR
jgi:hypothetical protein